jgi:hypothetical protein
MAMGIGRTCCRAAVIALAGMAIVVGLMPATAHAATSPVIVSEVAPWGSGTSSYGSDWWELTNVSAAPVDITGWKIDDNSNSFALAVPLSGVTMIAAGQSVIFIELTGTETASGTEAAFENAWFGSAIPTGFTIGTYTGTGVGLSATSDAVNVFDSGGNLMAGVAFGASTTNVSFDNAAGITNTGSTDGTISTLSVIGTNGAFKGSDNLETGSPGTIANTVSPVVPEAPFVILLPVGAFVILGAGIYLGRRRRRMAA